MKILGIDFFHYEVNDMQRSLAFYRDTLGLKLTMDPANTNGTWAEFEIYPSTLALYCPKNTEKRDAVIGAGALSLAVENVEEAIAELKEKGVNISFEPMETPVCHMAFIKDPDGNQIGIHHRKDGTFA